MGSLVTKKVNSVDGLHASESHRWLIRVIMIIRHYFRNLFGVEIFNQCGFFMDHQMSHLIHDFFNWVEYPKGDHVLPTDHALWAAVTSNDGYYLFTGSMNNTIAVWSLENCTCIKQWKAHDKGLMCLDFSARRGLLVSGSFYCSIKVWDTYDGGSYSLIHTLRGHSSDISSVRFFNNTFDSHGEWIVSGSSDESICLWSAINGKCIKQLRDQNPVRTVLPIQGLLLSGGDNNSRIRIWDVSTGLEIRSVSHGSDDDSIWRLCCNCDGSLVACIAQRSITIFQYPSMEIKRKLRFQCLSACFHPKNPWLLSHTDHTLESVRILDVQSGEYLSDHFQGHSGTVNLICFTCDGCRMITVSSDTSIRIWDTSHL